MSLHKNTDVNCNDAKKEIDCCYLRFYNMHECVHKDLFTAEYG